MWSEPSNNYQTESNLVHEKARTILMKQNPIYVVNLCFVIAGNLLKPLKPLVLLGAGFSTLSSARTENEHESTDLSSM